jgi:hypothetical protein
MEQTHRESHSSEVVIDLADVVRSLWRWKRFILIFTLGCTVAAALISLRIPNTYESEGIFQFGAIEKQTDQTEKFQYGLTLPEYRKNESILLNGDSFCELLSTESSLSEEKKAAIKRNFFNKSLTALSKNITPIYESSREDVRQFGGFVLGKDGVNSVIRFRLSWRDRSPEDAQRMVFFLARHLKNQLANAYLGNKIREEYSKYSVHLVGLDTQKIESDFKLMLLQQKLEDIRLLMKRYPNVDASSSRQIVSTQEGGYRYLSPANQAVGVESQILDIRQGLFVIERDLILAAFGADFYKSLAVELEKKVSGETLLAFYDEEVKRFAQSHDLGNDTTREFYNRISIRNEELKKTFHQTFRFIFEPTLPSTKIKPRRSIIVMVATFLAFFIALFIALIGYWWSNQKNAAVIGQR